MSDATRLKVAWAIWLVADAVLVNSLWISGWPLGWAVADIITQGVFAAVLVRRTGRERPILF